MKRLTLIWLTVLALLTQGWAAAAMAPAAVTAVTAAAAPAAGAEHCALHAPAAAKPAPAEKSGACCGAALDCHCVSACGGAVLLPAAFAPLLLPAASPLAATAAIRLAAAPAAHPFRPPIP